MRVNRVTKQPILPTPTPPAARGPGQHEEIIDRLQNGFERTLELLDIIVKQKPHETPKIVVELDTSVQREILEVVKDIQVDVRELKGIVTGGSGISEAAEQALAAQLQSAIGPLQEAIAANQPQGAPKKKKKNNPKQQ